MKNPIHVVVPAFIDPADPTVLLSVKIDLQDYPAASKPEETIRIVDAAGRLRKFEEIQAEWATKAIAREGTANAAEKPSGVTRQTLAKWAAHKSKK